MEERACREVSVRASQPDMDKLWVTKVLTVVASCNFHQYHIDDAILFDIFSRFWNFSYLKFTVGANATTEMLHKVVSNKGTTG